MAQKCKKQQPQIDSIFAATKSTVPNPSTQQAPARPPAKSRLNSAIAGKSDLGMTHIVPSKSTPKPVTIEERNADTEVAYADPTKMANTLRVAGSMAKKTYTAKMKLAQDLTVAELKVILKANGRPVSGKKGILLARLSEMNRSLDEIEEDKNSKGGVIPETPVKYRRSKSTSSEWNRHDPSILPGVRIRCQECTSLVASAFHGLYRVVHCTMDLCTS